MVIEQRVGFRKNSSAGIFRYEFHLIKVMFHQLPDLSPLLHRPKDSKFTLLELLLVFDLQ